MTPEAGLFFGEVQSVLLTGDAGGHDSTCSRAVDQPALDFSRVGGWLGPGRSSQVTYPHHLHRNIVTVPSMRALNSSLTMTSLLPTHRSQLGKDAAVLSTSVMNLRAGQGNNIVPQHWRRGSSAYGLIRINVEARFPVLRERLPCQGDSQPFRAIECIDGRDRLPHGFLCLPTRVQFRAHDAKIGPKLLRMNPLAGPEDYGRALSGRAMLTCRTAPERSELSHVDGFNREVQRQACDLVHIGAAGLW